MKYITKIRKCLSCKKKFPMLLVCAVLLGAVVFLVGTFGKSMIHKLSGREGFKPASELLLLHMTGCGHCKKMMPEWDNFSSNNKTGIKSRKVERSEDPALVKKHNVKGFPSILLLDSAGKKIKDYTGPRTAAGFKKFCEANSK
mgnify:FL=1|jgi:thiol-disulfide isomerase/thioredoxin